MPGITVLVPVCMAHWRAMPTGLAQWCLSAAIAAAAQRRRVLHQCRGKPPTVCSPRTYCGGACVQLAVLMAYERQASHCRGATAHPSWALTQPASNPCTGHDEPLTGSAPTPRQHQTWHRVCYCVHRAAAVSNGLSQDATPLPTKTGVPRATPHVCKQAHPAAATLHAAQLYRALGWGILHDSPR
jgi:hypothetical protein